MRRERRAPVPYYMGGEVYAEWIRVLIMLLAQGKACTCTTWVGKCRYAEWTRVLNLFPAQGKACTCTTWVGKCTRSGLEF